MGHMAERLLQRWGHHYILVMMIITRLFGVIGGLLVVYYVELSQKLPDPIRLKLRREARRIGRRLPLPTGQHMPVGVESRHYRRVSEAAPCHAFAPRALG